MDKAGPLQEVRPTTYAHILEGPRKLTLQNVPLEVFTPNYVQVCIQSIALSSSDLHYYETAAHYGKALTAPIILGRQAAGQITALGSNVGTSWPRLKAGSRVVIEPSLPCRLCQKCISGKYNVCVNMRSAACAGREPYVHGFLRQHVNWPGEMVHL